MRVNLPLSSMNNRNSTAKTIMAVASEARKLLSETPSSVLPWPPPCDKASSRLELMMISSQSGARLTSDEDQMRFKISGPTKGSSWKVKSFLHNTRLVELNHVDSDGGRAAHSRSGVGSEVKSRCFNEEQRRGQKKR